MLSLRHRSGSPMIMLKAPSRISLATWLHAQFNNRSRDRCSGICHCAHTSLIAIPHQSSVLNADGAFQLLWLQISNLLGCFNWHTNCAPNQKRLFNLIFCNNLGDELLSGVSILLHFLFPFEGFQDCPVFHHLFKLALWPRLYKSCLLVPIW